ncbi:MAG TPA: glycosyltransferase family 39 protein, partial [Vicinamibacteria bacterium]|nr:glycosyltransferase family 39 protein [Vicinamibacteria bacterium]
MHVKAAFATGAPDSPPPGFRLARAAVLALSALLLCRGITEPFNGWHEFNSAMYSVFARNHIEYGLGYTALYCTWGETAAAPDPPQRYLNHPPLIALWTAVPLYLLGDHEWSARLVPIAATLGSTWLLMTILSRLGGPLLGALAGFFFATLPLTVYFGRMIDHVAPVQLFSRLMVHGYLGWSGAYGPGRR